MRCETARVGQRRGEGTDGRQARVNMRKLDEPAVESRSAGPNTSLPVVATIDLDRFCPECGYNLRTLPVWREAHTGLPGVRCRVCGRLHPANDASTALRPWLRRATSLVLGLWILTTAAVFLSLGLAEGAESYGTLDELTVSGGSVTRRIGTSTIRTWGSGPLKIDPDYPEYRLFVASILVGSFLTAFVCGAFAVVVFPHWHRAACAGLVLAMPVAVNGLVALVWSHEAPQLFTWGMQYVIAHAGVQGLGGLVGVALGRPLARLAVRITLPPSLRPRLAFLWLADGKPLPRTQN